MPKGVRARQQWSLKPPLGFPIQWGHPLTKGLIGFYLFNEGGGLQTFNPVLSSRFGTLTNGPTWARGKYGTTVRTNGATTNPSYVSTTYQDFSFPQGTIVWRQLPETPPGDGVVHGMWGQITSVNVIPEFSAQKFLDNQFYIGWNRTGNDNRVVLAANESNNPQNTWSSYAFTWISNGLSVLYYNGLQIGVNGGTTVTSLIATNFDIGRQSLQGGSGSGSFQGQWDYFGLYNIVLSKDAIRRFHQNPYQIFTVPRSRIRFTPAPAVSQQQVDTGSYVFTGW